MSVCALDGVDEVPVHMGERFGRTADPQFEAR